MSGGSPKNRGPAGKKEGLVLTPGGWRSSSKVRRVEPGQHVEVQEGRLRVIETATGKVVADLGAVGEEGARTARGGGPMQKPSRPKPTK